jgi:3-oxoadipate enol-lactonase
VSSLTVDGTRIRYEVDGSSNAPALVLVNSLGTDLRMWDPQIDALRRRFWVVRYDCRGHGRSQNSRSPVTIERLGRDLLALLDHIAVARAHVCGLSLGGLTALWVAAHHPDRMDRAVFANTAARIGTSAGWEARIAAVRSGGMGAIREAVVARFLSESFRAERPETARAIGDMIEGTDAEGYIAACTALRDADLSAVVPRIRSNALIVGGAFDESTPSAQARALHVAIAGSELAILETAHLSNVEQPHEFSKRVIDFLLS